MIYYYAHLDITLSQTTIRSGGRTAFHLFLSDVAIFWTKLRSLLESRWHIELGFEKLLENNMGNNFSYLFLLIKIIENIYMTQHLILYHKSEYVWLLQNFGNDLMHSFSLFTAKPAAYGSSLARGQIRAAAVAYATATWGAKTHLWLTLQLRAMLDP